MEPAPPVATAWEAASAAAAQAFADSLPENVRDQEVDGLDADLARFADDSREPVSGTLDDDSDDEMVDDSDDDDDEQAGGATTTTTSCEPHEERVPAELGGGTRHVAYGFVWGHSPSHPRPRFMLASAREWRHPEWTWHERVGRPYVSVPRYGVLPSYVTTLMYKVEVPRGASAADVRVVRVLDVRTRLHARGLSASGLRRYLAEVVPFDASGGRTTRSLGASAYYPSLRALATTGGVRNRYVYGVCATLLRPRMAGVLYVRLLRYLDTALLCRVMELPAHVEHLAPLAQTCAYARGRQLLRAFYEDVLLRAPQRMLARCTAPPVLFTSLSYCHVAERWLCGMTTTTTSAVVGAESAHDALGVARVHDDRASPHDHEHTPHTYSVLVPLWSVARLRAFVADHLHGDCAAAAVQVARRRGESEAELRGELAALTEAQMPAALLHRMQLAALRLDYETARYGHSVFRRDLLVRALQRRYDDDDDCTTAAAAAAASSSSFDHALELLATWHGVVQWHAATDDEDVPGATDDGTDGGTWAEELEAAGVVHDDDDDDGGGVSATAHTYVQLSGAFDVERHLAHALHMWTDGALHVHTTLYSYEAAYDERFYMWLADEALVRPAARRYAYVIVPTLQMTQHVWQHWSTRTRSTLDAAGRVEVRAVAEVAAAPTPDAAPWPPARVSADSPGGASGVERVLVVVGAEMMTTGQLRAALADTLLRAGEALLRGDADAPFHRLVIIGDVRSSARRTPLTLPCEVGVAAPDSAVCHVAHWSDGAPFHQLWCAVPTAMHERVSTADLARMGYDRARRLLRAPEGSREQKWARVRQNSPPPPVNVDATRRALEQRSLLDVPLQTLMSLDAAAVERVQKQVRAQCKLWKQSTQSVCAGGGARVLFAERLQDARTAQHARSTFVDDTVHLVEPGLVVQVRGLEIRAHGRWHALHTRDGYETDLRPYRLVVQPGNLHVDTGTCTVRPALVQDVREHSGQLTDLVLVWLAPHTTVGDLVAASKHCREQLVIVESPAATLREHVFGHGATGAAAGRWTHDGCDLRARGLPRSALRQHIQERRRRQCAAAVSHTQ